MIIGQKKVTRLDVLDAISDAFGRELFTSIATDVNLDSIKITRKRYYARMSKLLKAGLIKRKNGRYVLTLFGNMIYELQHRFGKAVNDHFILKAF